MIHTTIKFAVYALVIGVVFSTHIFGITKVDLETPPNSGKFGTHAVALPNGNIVVTDPSYSVPGGAQQIGAVYVYNGSTGNLISTIKGTTANDMIGSGGVTVLANGNFVISSPLWDRGNRQDAGAATFGLQSIGTGNLNVVSQSTSLIGSFAGDKVSEGGITALTNGDYVVLSPHWDNLSLIDVGAATYSRGNLGRTGLIGPSNSLLGSHTDDYSFAKITPLPNGGYVVQTPNWDNGSIEDAGAATFGPPSTGALGSIQSVNSLVGSSEDDRVGVLVKVLTNGNYVVGSSNWRNGSNLFAGAATFGNGAKGVSGVVSSTNSLVGTHFNTRIGNIVDILPNGNYVVRSAFWDNGTTANVGAVTFGNGTTGVSGVVSSSNSLVGSSSNDNVGLGLIVLSNGNFVVSSRNWDNNGISNVGAATFVNGTTGLTGFVNTSNSLVGSKEDDQVGFWVTPLTNGNYVVGSRNWDNGAVINAGASTFGNGTTGITGFVSPTNSLIGSQENDRVGLAARALSNGNYVVISSGWSSGGTASVGAATFANGTSGITGVVTSTNSLIGLSAGDNFGNSITALTNGDYIVGGGSWDNGGMQNVGLITLGNGSTGTTGVVSLTNSIIGSSEGDQIGQVTRALPNGNFLIIASGWQNGAADNAGAVTFGNVQSGITGAVSPNNSLVGSKTNDFIGTQSLGSGVTILDNGDYVVKSDNWDNGSIIDAGSITYGDGNVGVSGEVSSNNSIVGTTPNGGEDLNWSYDESNDQLVVGQPNSNKVTLVTLTTNTNKTKFDFDGDSKTDVSIFRPAPAEWWFLRSSDGGNYAFQFGQNDDTLVPADYTGDGKADVAFFRESTGEWFVLRSEDSSFYSFPFGANGDIPAPGDFDGDGKADATVYRPSSGTWFINRSSDGNTDIVGFGSSEDKPVVADYDGDEKADIAIYRPSVSEWWINRSTDGLLVFQFGQAGDKTVQGDYTGDGKADVAFWRPNSGEWFVIRSEDQSFFSFPFGANRDVPTPGDYDGDGQQDAAVFRPATTTWFINGSTSGTQIIGFGANEDTPLPNAYVYE